MLMSRSNPLLINRPRNKCRRNSSSSKCANNPLNTNNDRRSNSNNSNSSSVKIFHPTSSNSSSKVDTVTAITVHKAQAFRPILIRNHSRHNNKIAHKIRHSSSNNQ